MARRRRKGSHTWFPNLGTNQAGTVEWSGRSLFLTVPPGGQQEVFSMPLTFDSPLDEPADVETSLADIVGSEYLIKRLVGKVHAEYIPQRIGGAGQWSINLAPAVRLTCGFYVARADHTDPEFPIGGNTTTVAGEAEALESYNPQSNAAIRESWMWRRTWVLSNAIWFLEGVDSTEFPGTGGGGEGASFPPNTARYTSVADGPHFDVKSARRVAKDERLFFATAVTNYPIGLVIEAIPIQSAQVRLELDYRILGSLRKAQTRASL